MTDDLVLTRLTVNLTPRSHAAMYAAAEVTGLSKTDTVNRALQFYAAVVRTAARHPGGFELTMDLTGDDDMWRLRGTSLTSPESTLESET